MHGFLLPHQKRFSIFSSKYSSPASITYREHFAVCPGEGAGQGPNCYADQCIVGKWRVKNTFRVPPIAHPCPIHPHGCGGNGSAVTAVPPTSWAIMWVARSHPTPTPLSPLSWPVGWPTIEPSVTSLQIANLTGKLYAGVNWCRFIEVNGCWPLLKIWLRVSQWELLDASYLEI